MTANAPPTIDISSVANIIAVTSNIPSRIPPVLFFLPQIGQFEPLNLMSHFLQVSIVYSHLSLLPNA